MRVRMVVLMVVGDAHAHMLGTAAAVTQSPAVWTPFDC
jgi:hypothetical protein